MKHYEVQVRISFFSNVNVQADDEEHAKEKAIRQAHTAMQRGYGSWGEEPEVVSVVEYGMIYPELFKQEKANHES